MISKKYFRMRSVRIGIIIFNLVIIIFIARFSQKKIESIQTGDISLAIEQSYSINLREISGLHVKETSQESRYQLTSVGDRFAILNQSIIDLKEKKIIDQKSIDFSEKVIDEYALCKSDRIYTCQKIKKELTRQWEAVASDATGRFFILQEKLATIVVYNSKKNRVDGLINLDNFDLTKPQKRSNSAKFNNNALGEGVVLLKNGRILVVKERQKSTVIEFGLDGEKASGYNAGDQVTMVDEFPVKQKRTNLVPLKYWKLPSKFKGCDLAEIQTSKEGKLFILSQQCRMIGQVETLNTNKKRLTFTKTWTLPKYIKQAESFVVLPHKKFLVAVDVKSDKADNVFLLK